MNRLLAALAFLLTSCTAAGTSPGLPAKSGPAISHARRPAPGPAHLYVANAVGQTVTVYPLGSQSRARTIATPVTRDSTSLVFDSAGKLYVSSGESGTGAVRVYEAGSNTLLRTISNGVSDLVAMAIDGSDNLYVSNYGGSPYAGSVTVFAPGGTKVERTITDGINGPFSMLCDASGNLYVGNFGASNVTVYAPGTTKVLRTIASGVSSPVSLAFDGQGNLYVGNYSSVSVYAPGSTSMLRSITAGVDDPHYLAFDGSNDLYVGNFKKTVTVYGPGGTSVVHTLALDAQVYGVVLDATNHPYVAWWKEGRGRIRGSVAMYSPDSSTATLVLRRPEGVRGPTALAIGP